MEASKKQPVQRQLKPAPKSSTVMQPPMSRSEVNYVLPGVSHSANDPETINTQATPQPFLEPGTLETYR